MRKRGARGAARRARSAAAPPPLPPPPMLLLQLLLLATPAAPASQSSPSPWLSTDGGDWQLCQEMQPLRQPCLLPNFTTTNFGCDVQLLEAEWNRSHTPAILDIYSCRPNKIWRNTDMRLAPAFPGGPHNPQNLSGLLEGWRDRLHGWLDDAMPMLSDGRIIGVYLGDELLCLGVPFSNYTAVADIVKARLNAAGSTAFVYSNECGNPFTTQGKIWSIPDKLPASLDQISIDTYERGASEVATVQQFYKEHMAPKMRPHQRLVLVPGLFGDSNLSTAGSVEQQEVALAAKLDAYWVWAQQQPQTIAGLNLWHWKSIKATGTAKVDTEYAIGAEGLPKVVERLQEIRKLLGPEPKPGPLPAITWKYINGTLRPFCC